MAAYPTLSRFAYLLPLEIELIGGQTLISKFENHGTETRKQKQIFATRNLILKYKDILKADIRLLWQFYQARGGSFEAFNIFIDTNLGPWIATDSYVGEYVGIGDDSTVTFNLPGKSCSGYTVYLDGVTQEDTVAYNLYAGTGTDGADKITFAVAPEASQKITIDFTGTFKIHGRFEEDRMSYSNMYDCLMATGLKIIGLLNT